MLIASDLAYTANIRDNKFEEIFNKAIASIGSCDAGYSLINMCSSYTKMFIRDNKL